MVNACRLLTPAGPIADACSLDKPQDGVHTVVIDSSGFTFIDSVGLHVLPAVSRFKLLAYEPIALQCYVHDTVVTQEKTKSKQENLKRKRLRFLS